MKSSFQNLLIVIACAALPVFGMMGCMPNESKNETSNEAVTQTSPGYNQFKNSKITVEVFKVDSIETNGSRGWGYDIMIDEKLYIHQPNIPAIMGNNGFSSEENAKKAGEFIVNKIRNNIMPPSVSPEELDSLGVID